MPSATENGWDESAGAWIEFVRKGDSNRVHVLDEPMLRRCGDVAGLHVVDIGCGEGRFCRMLAEGGAHVTGIDPTWALIAAARESHSDGEYVEARGECVPLGDGCADLVVSYLSLIDIPDFRAAIAEMVRIAKPGGRLVAANLNSFTTAAGKGWRKDDQGRKLDFPVDRYCEERADRVQWAGISIDNWHRPFDAYMQAFLSHGLRLTHFEEPRPTAAAIQERPDLAEHLRVSNFHILEWRKD